MSNIAPFGQLPDGQTVHQITLGNGVLQAQILTWGAVLRDLRLAGHQPPLVLGLNSIEDYLTHSRSFGATLGRCANRISGAQFHLDGQSYQLEANEAGGQNCIHGGSTGASRRIWQVQHLSDTEVILSLRDPDGNAGFPGDVDSTCHISLRGGAVVMRHESRSSAPTPVNLADHSYFNLDGRADIRNHQIQIAATHYLPVNGHKIPDQGQSPVAGSAFDFQQMTDLGPRLDQTGGFDHNFCVSDQVVALRPVAWVRAVNGLSLEVATTEPGVQFFTAPTLNIPVPGLDGRRYGAAAGLCLETQIWPDAINQPGFPEVVLRPGAVRLQETEYRFSQA